MRFFILQWRFGIKLAESSTSAATISESYSELCRESIIILGINLICSMEQKQILKYLG